MDRLNTGWIRPNKPFTPEAMYKIIDLLGTARWRMDMLVFDEYYDKYFDETIEELIKKLEPLGYVLYGNISYHGDDDGVIEIHGNKVTRLTADEAAIKNADDGDLIRELSSRGYKVIEEM